MENFHSKDLHQDGIFILDAYFELFVWVGEDTLSIVRDLRLALDTAMVSQDSRERKKYFKWDERVTFSLFFCFLFCFVFPSLPGIC